MICDDSSSADEACIPHKPVLHSSFVLRPLSTKGKALYRNPPPTSSSETPKHDLTPSGQQDIPKPILAGVPTPHLHPHSAQSSAPYTDDPLPRTV
ncbi:hypothetical protein NMY22_g6390 [Coprinellus aureogranulatus]|nr:hypothetical protein NMY22_g6390 [Coprinellus aureogranulatus]